MSLVKVGLYRRSLLPARSSCFYAVPSQSAGFGCFALFLGTTANRLLVLRRAGRRDLTGFAARWGAGYPGH